MAYTNLPSKAGIISTHPNQGSGGQGCRNPAGTSSSIYWTSSWFSSFLVHFSILVSMRGDTLLCFVTTCQGPHLLVIPIISFSVSSVQSLSCVRFFATPWTAACQVSLSLINSRSLLKLMSIESVMPSSHLILCHPLLLPPSIFPSIRVFSNESVLCIRWPKYWSFSFSISPSNEYSGLISFRMDWLDLLAVQGTLKSLLQHHSSKASILRRSAFLTVQLSHPYMTAGKTIALTRRTFVGKVISLLFNMLSRLVIAFLPRSKHHLISRLQSPPAVILESRKIKSVIFFIISPSICHEVMGLDAWNAVVGCSIKNDRMISVRF